MLDIKWIVNNQNGFFNACSKRGINVDVTEVVNLEKEKIAIMQKIQQLQTRKNEIANQIPVLKNSNAEEGMILSLIQESKNIDGVIKELSHACNVFEAKLLSIIEALPNILQDSVPVGNDESGNVLVAQWCEKPTFEFQPKEHWELGEKLGLLDFDRATKLAGSRFSIMKGRLAKLERVLRSFMVDICVREFGYEEMFVPYLLNSESMYRSGQLPKLEEDMFKTNTGHYLIPTAETSLVNIYANEVIASDRLPIRMCAYSPCFRSEAGSAGRDTAGILRQHQFTKVEIVSIVEAEESEAEHTRMLKCATTILERLGLHYRIMLLCSGDTGFCSSKTYDIEVWMPGQGKYREICSCSNTTTFQSRRAGIRTKGGKDKSTRYVHMLNSSALPLGRTIIALIENYQTAEGDFTLPACLDV